MESDALSISHAKHILSIIALLTYSMFFLTSATLCIGLLPFRGNSSAVVGVWQFSSKQATGSEKNIALENFINKVVKLYIETSCLTTE